MSWLRSMPMAVAASIGSGGLWAPPASMRASIRAAYDWPNDATWASVAPADLNAATAAAVRAAQRWNGGATTAGALLAASFRGPDSAGATATSYAAAAASPSRLPIDMT